MLQRHYNLTKKEIHPKRCKHCAFTGSNYMIYVKANKNWGVLAPHFLQSPSKPVGDKKRGNKNDFFVLLYSCQTGNGVPFCYDQIGVQCNCIEQLHFK